MDAKVKVISLLIFIFFIKNIVFSQSFVIDEKVNYKNNREIIKKYQKFKKQKKNDIKILIIYNMSLVDKNIKSGDTITKDMIINGLEFQKLKKRGKWFYNFEGIIYKQDSVYLNVNTFHSYFYKFTNFYGLDIYSNNLLTILNNNKFKNVFIIGEEDGQNYWLVDKKGDIYILIDKTTDKNNPNYQLIPFEQYIPIVYKLP